MKIDPYYAEAHKNLGLIDLRQLDFERGFDLYEWRWKTDQNFGKRLVSDKPAWSGESGKAVFIWSEQGIGDELMFSTILKEAQAVCSKLILRCDERLIPLFERSFSGNIRFVTGKESVPETEYDYQLPVGSLPRLFRKSLESFQQGAGAFLQPDQDRVKHLRDKLRTISQQPICGISWRGGKKGAARLRSIDLALLAKTLSDSNQTLVNLQYDATDAELQALEKNHGIKVFTIPEVDNFHDLDGLAALISACDNIVSVTNTTVHLASVLGVHTHALIPFAPDWRWGRESQSSYWYNAPTLHRQNKINDWTNALINLGFLALR